MSPPKAEMGIKMKKAFSDLEFIDYKRAMMLYDDDDEMFEVILESFVTHTPVVLEKMEALFTEITVEIQAASNNHESKDELYQEFGILAHGIKGSCSSIAAEGLREQAAGLEKAAKDCDLANCQKRYPQLVAGIKAMLAELE